MFNNILNKSAHLPNLTRENVADYGFLTPKQYEDQSAGFDKGSVVEVVVEDEGFRVYRIILGKVTTDLWDEDDQTMLLRWPNTFREDYMTVYGIKLIEPAKSAEEAVADLVAFVKTRMILSSEEEEIFQNKLAAISALSAVSTVDWDSSSLYC